ncbi:unnamed protein product [Lymnaea stagnalis]|uniref:Hexosyltransferase n=1 Tax=Lymnaea stagnalis TaxID=6523 RepID=A0AAV2HWV4_LYMST
MELEEAEQGEVNKSLISKSSILQIVDVKTLRKFAMKLEAEVQAKKSVISFLTQPVMNHHNYVYIHNPSNVCTLHRTEVLLVVPSAPGNFENRAKVRLSKRGGYVRNWRNGAVLLFFIGNPSNDESGIEIQTKIDKESLLYGDIVQENFEDVYKNIRLKAVSMLKWASTFCQETKYVIRTDDDVRVDIPKLLSVLEAKSRRYTDFIIGDRKDGWAAVRDTTDKYYLSVDEYEPSTLPPFAVGGLLGYPISTVTLLYQAALRIKPVWLDDIFITGICAPRVNVPLLSDPDFVFKHKVW